MAVLSGKKSRNGPSSSHDFDRISDKIYGSMRHKINRMTDVYSSDYIYVYKELDDDEVHDGEIGVNKTYHRIHDMDWCNGEKNEHHAMNRYFDGLEEDDGNVDIDDLLNDDGSLNMDSLADLLDGEGHYDE